MTQNKISSNLLVIGAGIAGISSALEAAETGLNVILIDKEPFIGGNVARFNRYFPKLCPPGCGLEINIRRLRTNPAIKLFTLAEVASVKKNNGKYNVGIKVSPRHVNRLCTACGDCAKVCPEKTANEFNYKMDETTSVNIANESAYPQQYVIDMKTCKGESCNKCVEVCKYNAIELNQTEETIDAEVDSIIVATGWEPYNAENIEVLQFGKHSDIITNVIMERLASPNGPTKGQILRLSSNEKINSVAFVQCAGSRDENYLEYCSSVCCMASIKQAKYIREQHPEAEVHIHYIDIRANGILESFYNEVSKDEKIHFHRGKVAKVFHNPETNKMVVEAEDTLTGNLMQNPVELVVLATGMKPNSLNGLTDEISFDKNGFLNLTNGAITGCGVITEPKEVASVVQEATGAVLTALQTINRN